MSSNRKRKDRESFSESSSQEDSKISKSNQDENLGHKKLLSRIERGKFCKINFRDENAIGTFVVKNGAVAYWSALNLHGLTGQFSNAIFIQTTYRKTDKTLFGTPYKFVTINPGKRTGIKYNGYGNAKYPITDMEKTIIDCFDQPQYSGGYAELLRALSQAEIDADKMINYCRQVGNTAATKKIGFLVEFFEKPSMDKFIDFAKEQINEKYNLFDPQGTEKGEFIAGWKLRLNISKDELINLSDKQY